MAGLGQRFDATAHDTTQNDYAELPNGIYKLEIETSDVGPTKAGNGTILKTTMLVIEPEALTARSGVVTCYPKAGVSYRQPQRQACCHCWRQCGGCRWQRLAVAQAGWRRFQVPEHCLRLHRSSA